MKTYADQCLERAEKATKGPWKAGHSYHFEKNAEFIAHSRTDVPELARRLKKACDLLGALKCGHYDTEWLADELEKLPECSRKIRRLF